MNRYRVRRKLHRDLLVLEVAVIERLSQSVHLSLLRFKGVGLDESTTIDTTQVGTTSLLLLRQFRSSYVRHCYFLLHESWLALVVMHRLRRPGHLDDLFTFVEQGIEIVRQLLSLLHRIQCRLSHN